MRFSQVQIVVGTPEMLRKGRGEVGLTLRQAANLLGVSDGRVLQLIRQGELAPCAKMGTAFVFREKDVLDLAERRG